jgi:hypothetical protein
LFFLLFALFETAKFCSDDARFSTPTEKDAVRAEMLKTQQKFRQASTFFTKVVDVHSSFPNLWHTINNKTSLLISPMREKMKK